jgi:hypothetical protein
MRKLSRENRTLTDELVQQGGEMVLQTLCQVKRYRMTLLKSPDEFFRSSNDEPNQPQADGDRAVVELEEMLP